MKFNDVELLITWHGETHRVMTTTQAWDASTKVFEAVKDDFEFNRISPAGKPHVREFTGEQGLAYDFLVFRKTPAIARQARKQWGYTSDAFTSERPDRYILAAHRLRALKYANTAPDCPVKPHGDKAHVCPDPNAVCTVKAHGEPGHVCEGIELVESTRQKVPKTKAKDGKQAGEALDGSADGTGQADEDGDDELSGGTEGLENGGNEPEGAGEGDDGSPSLLLQERIEAAAAANLASDNPKAGRRQPKGASDTGIGILRSQAILDRLTYMSGDAVLVHTIEFNGITDTLVMKNGVGDDRHRIMMTRMQAVTDMVTGASLPPSAPVPSAYITAAKLAEYFVEAGPEGASASDAIRDLGPWDDEDPRASKEFPRWQDCFNDVVKSAAFHNFCGTKVKVKPQMGPDEFGRPTVPVLNAHNETIYAAEAV